MSSKISEKIRKLRRTARGVGPEAELADQLARELADKHGVRVDDDDEVEQRAPGVAGVFWRERLFSAIAQSRECVARWSGGKRDAMVRGRRSRVEATRALYRRVRGELESACADGWRQFVGGSPHARRGAKLWLRVFMDTAALGVIDRLERGDVVDAVVEKYPCRKCGGSGGYTKIKGQLILCPSCGGSGKGDGPEVVDRPNVTILWERKEYRAPVAHPAAAAAAAAASEEARPAGADAAQAELEEELRRIEEDAARLAIWLPAEMVDRLRERAARLGELCASRVSLVDDVDRIKIAPASSFLPRSR